MEELTKFQKSLLERFSKEKKVHFQYDVTDCENNGDVLSAIHRVENFVKPLGGTVVDAYWNGKDCGEAWIECTIPYSSLEQVLKTGFFRKDPWQ